MIFLVNLMFRRLDKFDGFVFGVCVCVCVCVWGGGRMRVYTGDMEGGLYSGS